MRSERWWQDRCEAHVHQILQEMHKRGVILNRDAVRRLMIDLQDIWEPFMFGWRIKLDHKIEGSKLPRSDRPDPWAEWRVDDHFKAGEYNPVEGDWALSVTPLRLFLPVIKAFVDDPANNFPAQRHEKDGRSFRFASLDTTEFTKLPPHQWFAVLVGKFFSEQYGPHNWRSANAYIEKHGN